MIKAVIIGYGNIGRHCINAIKSSADIELVGIVRRELNSLVLCENKDLFVTSLNEITVKPDVALLCIPSRLVEEYIKECLALGINTVDSFDIHEDIYGLKTKINGECKRNNTVSMIACGWDPGVDSVIRAIMECCTSHGVTYTDFGIGMSMGHSVVAKSKNGVKDAVSLTVPVGYGIHKRIVYVDIIDGYDIKEIEKEIKRDSYFVNDDTVVIATNNIDDVKDMGHGVTMSRKGVSSGCHNQMLKYDMRINNPAVTAQIMVNSARASKRMVDGAYTMVEVPPIYYLSGKDEDIIKKLV